MTNKLQFLCFVLLLSLGSISGTHAQYNTAPNKVWKFGKKAGLNFNTNPPQVFEHGIALASMEGSASVCDANGNFLFHTDGTNVWDANDALMPNGGGLTSFPNNPTVSTVQGSVIVPVPDSAGQYFIFSLPEWSTTVSFGKLFCNKVKMNLNGGLGDVDTSFPLRHIILDSLFTERMTVVPGCGNSWLVLYKRDTTGFRAFRITADGIDNNPVVSNVGNFPVKNYRQGSLRASHDGKLLVNTLFKPNISAGDGVELYDFDPITGLISNARILDSMSSFAAEFSPDNSKLYVHFAGTLITSAIYQYDLSLPLWSDVVASKTFLGYCSPITDVRLGPDSVIYFNRHFMNTKIIGSINQPNLAGIASNYQDTTFTLPGAAYVYYAFPQQVISESVSNVDTVFSLVLDTTICPIADTLTLALPAHATNITWNTGDTTNSINTLVEGIYYASYMAPCPQVDTFIIRKDFPEWFITVNEKILGVSYTFDTYQWYKNAQLIPGATNSTYTVTENGLYTVEVGLLDCTDTLTYQVTNANSLGDYTTPINIDIYPIPFKDKLVIKTSTNVEVKLIDLLGRTLINTKNQSEINTSMIPAGTYFIEIRDANARLIQTKKVVKINE